MEKRGVWLCGVIGHKWVRLIKHKKRTRVDGASHREDRLVLVTYPNCVRCGEPTPEDLLNSPLVDESEAQRNDRAIADAHRRRNENDMREHEEFKSIIKKMEAQKGEVERLTDADIERGIKAFFPENKGGSDNGKA